MACGAPTSTTRTSFRTLRPAGQASSASDWHGVSIMGVLNRQEYLPAVEKAWAGLTQSLSPEGEVLWGQQVGDRPRLVARESTHEYVTGTFLLAGSDVYKLAH